MRCALLGLLLVAACGGGTDRDFASGGDIANDGVPPTAVYGSCARDSDCRPAAPTCCECPTFAVAATDPLYAACSEVMCPTDPTAPSCPAAVDAVCDEGQCVLACEPMACSTTGTAGYAVDASGCLTCIPNLETDPDPASSCQRDTDCIETRADCCGCARGGADTAVLVGQQASYDAALGCSADASCPAVDTCEPGAEPECIQGACKLLADELPANACGRADLPACPSGTACTVNLDEGATVRGLGVCAPNP